MGKQLAKNKKDNNPVISVINEKDIPAIISEQFTKLKELNSNVDAALKKAEEAQTSAQNAKSKSAGLFQKKAAIESLQDATVDLAEAQMASAEAQTVSFEYQQKLSEITKYLFGLGVSNIAANRSIVRELEMRLNGASQEELDDLAREELIGVVKQLKAQEDIMKKQTKLSSIVREHEARLEERELKDIEHDDILKEKTIIDEAQDKEIERQAKVDEELKLEIEEQAKNLARQDKLLDSHKKKDKEQDDEITRQAEVDTIHDKEIAELHSIISNQEELIVQLQEKCTHLEAVTQDLNIRKGNKPLVIFAAMFAFLAWVMALISLLI